jgi:hypothetical protein
LALRRRLLRVIQQPAHFTDLDRGKPCLAVADTEGDQQAFFGKTGQTGGEFNPLPDEEDNPISDEEEWSAYAPQPARGVEPDETMLSRSPRGELFTRGYRSSRGCRDFRHSDGKHAFDASRDQRLYRLKPSFNGGSVPAKSPHGHALRRMELSHSSYIHQRGRFRSEKATTISPHSESFLV